MSKPEQPAEHDRAWTGIFGLHMKVVIGRAASFGLYVIVEPNEYGKAKWTLYDRKEGRVVATYFPKSKSLLVTGRRPTKARWLDAIRLAAGREARGSP